MNLLANGGGTGAGVLLLVFLIAMYFAPSMVAYSRRDALNNVGAIVVLNVFAGWTMIGWIVALVWASKNENRK